jgi:hypothetical protein
MTRNTHTSIGTGILGVVIIGGLLWELTIVKALWGFWVAALALFLFPGTLALVPWYMLFVYGNWQLLIFTYGGGLLGCLVHCFGDEEPDEHTENVKPTCETDTTENSHKPDMEKTPEKS